MKDMKRSYESVCMPCDPEYSGLKLYLSDDQLKSLGMTELPEVGTMVYLKAEAMVKRTSEEESTAGETKSMCLEIITMDAKAKTSTAEEDASKLYPKEKED